MLATVGGCGGDDGADSPEDGAAVEGLIGMDITVAGTVVEVIDPMLFIVANGAGRVLVSAPREGQLDPGLDVDATIEVRGTVARIVGDDLEGRPLDLDRYDGELALLADEVVVG